MTRRNKGRLARRVDVLRKENLFLRDMLILCLIDKGGQHKVRAHELEGLDDFELEITQDDKATMVLVAKEKPDGEATQADNAAE